MKRVLPYLLFFLCLGILAAHRISSPFLIIAFIAVSAVVCAAVTKRGFAALFPLMFLVGMNLTLAADTDPYTDALFENAAAAREKVCVEGVVDSFYKNTDGYVYKLKADRFTFEDGSIITKPYGIRLMSPLKFDAGDVLRINARIYVHNGKFNPSDFDSRLYLKIHGYSYSFYCDDPKKDEVGAIGHKSSFFYMLGNKMYALRVNINAVYDKYFDEKEAGILKSIITGDRSGLDSDAADSFRNAGIYHFLAISGLHLSVISACLLTLFGRISKKAAVLFTSVFLLLYCVMVGSGVSVMRAVVMAHLYMLCRLLGRRYDLINSVSLAAIVLLLVNPLFIYDTGFLYSFGAVFGIALVSVYAENVQKFRPAVTAFCVSFGASVFTRIITLFNFYTVNIFDILINMLLALPLGALVAAAFAFGVTGLLPVNMTAVSKPLKLCIDGLIGISDLLGHFGVVTVGHPSEAAACLIFISALLFLLFILGPSKRRAAVMLVTVPLVCAVSAAGKDRGVNVSFLYVGQGDSCVISSGDSAYIIDCGGNILSDIGADAGRYRIMPYLDYSNIKKVKAVFISHTDADHIKGLFDMLGKVDIEKIYLSEYADENENYDTLCELAGKSNVPIERISAGESVTDGELVFKCLFPYSFNEKDNNDNSMVLLFEHKNDRILFTGDIGMKAEAELLTEDIKTDILKVSHHGSKNSTGAEFLAASAPKIAVASAGKNNRFGHPSKETTERIRESGADLYVTYDGMVSFKSTGNGFE